MKPKFKIGQKIISLRSFTSLTIKEIDLKNGYYIGTDGRAVKFNECQEN